MIAYCDIIGGVLMKNCVYRIINKTNNKVYIGSTIDAERRKIEHFSQLENNKHINPHLQNAYNKYGKESFLFDIIEHGLDDGELLIREQHYIDLFNASNNNFGYNISSYANQPDTRKYTKLYTVKFRSLINNTTLSMNAIGMFGCFQAYLEMYTNRIAKPSGENLTNKDIIKITKLSENTVYKILNELEEGNIIKRVGNRQSRQIYLNPYIVTAGTEIQQETYDMFK